jgi:transposase-like protein
MVGVLATGQDGLEREHNQPSDMKNKAQKNRKNQAITAANSADSANLAQEVSSGFQQMIRSAVRGAAEALMVEEVVKLCGELYRPVKGSGYRRAGSEKGVLRYDGQKEAICRPRDRAEAMRLFKRLRVAQGAAAAEEAFAELEAYLGKKHQGSQQSLQGAKEHLLIVHGFELAEALQRSLLSTNAIENVMRNVSVKCSTIERS